MRFLITGYTGQLGYDISRELKKRGFVNILAVGSKDMDITDKFNVVKTVLSFKPDIIFHSAAYTNVEMAEENNDICYEVNVNGTRYIVEAAKRIGAKIIYISTDYVFDGTKNGIYEIDDDTNPKNMYGKSKFWGELITKQYDKHFIVRTSWVFGINGDNFIKKILNFVKSKNELKIVNDQIGSPTYTVDLAKFLVDLSMTEKYGIYHATNEGYCSWAELAEYVAAINKLDVKVNKISSMEYITKAERPLNSRLSKKSLTKNGFSLLPSWKSAVKRYSVEVEVEVQK